MPLIHVTFASALFGFIDDMYIQTGYGKDTIIFVEFMSESRVGGSDFGQNSDHIQKVLSCVDKAVGPDFGLGYKPCTLD